MGSRFQGYVREQVQRLEDCIGTAEIVALSTSNVLFLLVLHPEHVSAAERGLELLASRWPGQFWFADNASSNLPAPSRWSLASTSETQSLQSLQNLQADHGGAVGAGVFGSASFGENQRRFLSSSRL